MKLLLIKCAKYLLLPLGVVCALFKRKDAYTILMYHRVNNAVNKELSVRESDFLWQMDYLHREGYHVVTLDEAIRLPNAKLGKSVVLSFDDGYEDFYTAAYPILHKYGFPAILYIAPGYVDTGRVFPWDQDAGESPLLSWRQIAKLHSAGLVQFGSHSMTHPDFNRIDREEAERELVEAKELLYQRLGVEAKHFAYPRGIVAHKDLVQPLHQTAVSIFDGYREAHAGQCYALTHLRRTPVQRSDGKALFAARLKGWLFLEGWLKQLLGRH